MSEEVASTKRRPKGKKKEPIRTAKEVDNALLEEGRKKERYSAGGGLALELRETKNGVGKYWVYRYKGEGGNSKEMNLGVYNPKKGAVGHLSLAQAREAVVEAKKKLREGFDPAKAKQLEKENNRNQQIVSIGESERTFKAVSLEWVEFKAKRWAPKTQNGARNRLETYAWPIFGDLPMNQITKAHTSKTIGILVKANKLELAERVEGYIRNTFLFAIDRGLFEGTAADIPLAQHGTLIPEKVVKKAPALTDEVKVGELLRAIDGYENSFIIKMAMRILPYLAVRSEAFRQMKWADMDFENAVWTIPAIDRKLTRSLKMNSENFHRVPLSKQALELLGEMRVFSGNGKYVFPNERGVGRPMSDGGVNAGLAALGYKNVHCGHGFRSTFSSILRERGFNGELIEMQLEHVERSSVKAAYMRSDLLDRRRELMQAWADILDELRAAV